MIDSIVEGKSRPLSAVEWMGTIVTPPPTTLALPSVTPKALTPLSNPSDRDEAQSVVEQFPPPLHPFAISPLSLPSTLPSLSSASFTASPEEESSRLPVSEVEANSAFSEVSSLADVESSSSSSSSSSASSHSPTDEEEAVEIGIDEMSTTPTRNWRYESLIPSPTLTYSYVPTPLSPTLSDAQSTSIPHTFTQFHLDTSSNPPPITPTKNVSAGDGMEGIGLRRNRRVIEIGSTTKDRVEKGRSFFLDKDLVLIDKDWIGRRNTIMARSGGGFV